MFSGSYSNKDVQFLLKRITIPAISIEEKEKAIQVEKKHYSQMLTLEKAPTESYMQLYSATLDLNGERFAKDIWKLAHIILNNYISCSEITLVSLARAGTPIGVLLKDVLIQLTQKPVVHYSVSIIRDFGIDTNAIDYIVQHHNDNSLCFIDAWTGKGVIGQELKASINSYNIKNNVNIPMDLYVVTDIAGTADFASCCEDYLLPNAVLNATVSGLVSRTVLNKEYIGVNDFHGCVFYDHLKQYDVSNSFIQHFKNKKFELKYENNVIDKKALQEKSRANLKYYLDMYGLDDQNFVKPGIGETTRVFLRRTPKVLWVKDKFCPEVEHLIYLAKQRNVPIYEDKSSIYKATAVIEIAD